MSASAAETINLNTTGSSSSSSSSSGSSSSSSGSSSSSSSSSSLPSGWTSADIGNTVAAGSASYSSGVYTITGSGADITGTADAFHYVYTTLTGNGSIVAQVSNQTDANSSAKAGVMFRDGTAANAEEVSISMDPTGLAHFDERSTAGGNTNYSSAGGLTSTEWLELVRAGNTITAYVSTDGKTWQQVSSATMTLDATLEVGLDVSAHDAGAIESAEFSNVSVTAATTSSTTTTTTTTTSLPSGWTSADIGTTGAAGSATFSNNSYTVTGSGADITGTADAFQFVYTTLTGNGSIVAEVSNETDANASAKAGLMIRDGTAANAKEVSISKDPGGLAHLDQRTTTGGNTS
jgi:hypothetical protein